MRASGGPVRRFIGHSTFSIGYGTFPVDTCAILIYLILVKVITDTERFQLFVGILDCADYEFVGALNRRAEREFRRERVRIFRRELRLIADDSANLYRVRASNLAAAGRWSAYPRLVSETIGSFVSIGKLALAGTLLAWRLPLMIDAASNASRVLRFVSGETVSLAPQKLPA
jgi:hypothetical protein